MGDKHTSANVNVKLMDRGLDRSQTAGTIFSQYSTVKGLSVLDVGCSFGCFCVHAKLLGAGKVVGIESREPRYSKALENAAAAGVDVEYLNIDFFDYRPSRKYDLVLLLNVLHHASYPLEMVKRCADACEGDVWVEFATVKENRFLKRSRIPKIFGGPLAKLPIVGIGPDEYKTTFYFTKSSFQLIFVKHLKLFKSIDFFPSDMGSDRLIAKCHV